MKQRNILGSSVVTLILMSTLTNLSAGEHDKKMVLLGTLPTQSKLEAFCDEGHYRYTLTQSDENKFKLELPKEEKCRLVITAHPDDIENRVISPIDFNDYKGKQSIVFEMKKDKYDLGYMDIPISVDAIDDAEANHVKDTPYTIYLEKTKNIKVKVKDDDKLDSDGDGIVNAYEDDDADGILNIFDNDYAEHNDDENEDDKATTPTPMPNPTPIPPVVDVNLTGNYMLSAWNDLGMHCMDGNDYSVFSVLPPYNNLHAQIKDKNGKLITSGIRLTYESVKGTDGKINTTSELADDGSLKTNFWDYVQELFGVSLPVDTGLTGKTTPNTVPAYMEFNPTHQWWEAEGIPITPYNDDGTKNYYPLIQVTAKDSAGNVLAQVKTVLPVSDEMDCKRCHSSTGLSTDAQPKTGWVNMADVQKDYKFNILRLHDEKEPKAVSDNSAALSAKGYNYSMNGLEETAMNGTPVLCVACHKSNALPGVGIELKAFTQVIHGKHADVVDPLTQMKLSDSANRSACYACHPGAKTECLRGAMGDATNADGSSQMQCQSCHGSLSSVAHSGREGWLDEPNCQSCHYDGKREQSAIDPQTGFLREVLDTRFATNANTPMPNISLYRFSTGHGDLQCESCHGATHAVFPAHQADNILSEQIQGHSGTIAECTACHTTVPKTVDEGPHGMHTVGESWVKDHKSVAEKNSAQCTLCHGADYRGSFLSKMSMTRVLDKKTFQAGQEVSCYACHDKKW